MAGQKCACCAHADRDAIDLAIAGGQSQRATAEKYGVSRGSLARHAKLHIPATVKKAAEQAEADRGEDLYREVSALHAKTLGILDDALAASENAPAWARRKAQPELALRAIREARANLELMARLQGDLDDGAAVTVVIEYEDDWRAGAD